MHDLICARIQFNVCRNAASNIYIYIYTCKSTRCDICMHKPFFICMSTSSSICMNASPSICMNAPFNLCIHSPFNVRMNTASDVCMNAPYSKCASIHHLVEWTLPLGPCYALPLCPCWALPYRAARGMLGAKRRSS